ncbi:MAG TPA: ABC transporter permease [Conexibacter sp.]|nr:ABC transporter permease [Conexibacter sp.]
MSVVASDQDQLDAALDRRLARVGRRSARWRRFTLEAGIALIALVIVASIVGEFVYPNPNAQDLAQALLPPSLAHPFGTDNLGRDVLARTLAGTWIDLGVALGATYLALVLGVVCGTVAGYFRGWPERIIMRFVEVVLALPFMVLVIAIVAIMGPGITGVFVGLTIGGWGFYARLARAEMLVLNEKSFVHAAQTLGYSHWRVMWRHAIPNLIRPSLVYSMSDIVLNITWVASLSYLGLGVQPPTPEWGSIIADGQSYLLNAWWISTLPGLVVVIVGIGFSLVGDGLADRLRARRAVVR